MSVKYSIKKDENIDDSEDNKLTVLSSGLSMVGASHI